MDVRTVGVEEELLLVDPGTRAVSGRSAEVLQDNREHGSGRHPAGSGDELDQELFLHQSETRTDPTTGLNDVARQLVAARRTAGEAATAAGLGVIACGGVRAHRQRRGGRRRPARADRGDLAGLAGDRCASVPPGR